MADVQLAALEGTSSTPKHANKSAEEGSAPVQPGKPRISIAKKANSMQELLPAAL